MYLKEKVFSSPSLGNVKFSYTDVNFYKKKKDKKQKTKLYSLSDYKNLFKNYYKNKKQINTKDSKHEINSYYLKCLKNVKNYFSNDKNKYGLKFDGNKKLESYSLNKFNYMFSKTCSAREQILQNKILDYYYPKDNEDKLMGIKMKLTPIPSKRYEFMKNDKEKEDYLKAKRSAVCMRRLEYTYGLRKNNSQEFIKDSSNDKNNEYDNYLAILKGAVLIIEDWWINILNRRYYLYQNFFEEDDDTVINITEKDSTNSIEQNILKNLIDNRENRDENIIVEDWISRQTKRILDKKEKDKKIQFNNEYNIINQNKTIKLNKSNNIKLRNKNTSNLLFKSNRRYHNCNGSNINKSQNKNKNIISQRNNQKYPIKIIQNANIPFEIKSNIQTVFSPSNYLQHYYKDYCLNNKNLYNTHKSLKSFEIIENKFQSNKKQKYRNLSSLKNNIDYKINQEEIVNQDFNLNEDKNFNKSVLRAQNKNKKKIKKDFSSDIEPVNEDEMINICNEDRDSYNNANNKKEVRKMNKYEIKYNIIKNRRKENSNQNTEKSSMDGSVDEIITRKLKEIHENNQKYTQRILKAYNQVKFFKSYSLEKKRFFNRDQINNYQSAPFLK